MSIDHEKDTKKKIPRVPETLLKKRKKFETLKAAREEAARKEEKVIVFYHFYGKHLVLNSSSYLIPFYHFSLILCFENAMQSKPCGFRLRKL